jgi:hypothetical protein
MTDPTTVEVFPWRAAPTNPHIDRANTDAERLATLATKTYEVRLSPRLPLQSMRFHSIGDLAIMMGRSPVTMRKWETDFLLPRTPFTYPLADSPLERDDQDAPARRLYTPRMTLGVVAIAREEGVLEMYAKPVGKTQFTPKVAELFQQELEYEIHLQTSTLQVA